MGRGRLEAFSDACSRSSSPSWCSSCGSLTRPNCRPAPAAACLSQLCPQLRLPRDLLEQPSPHAACTSRVTGAILWANLHLLFWLSLVPFVTGWMGENHFAPVPTALYGVVLLMAAIAYLILQRQILRAEGPGSLLAGHWARHQGQDLAGALRARDRRGVRPSLDLRCALRGRRAHVADS